MRCAGVKEEKDRKKRWSFDFRIWRGWFSDQKSNLPKKITAYFFVAVNEMDVSPEIMAACDEGEKMYLSLSEPGMTISLP